MIRRLQTVYVGTYIYHPASSCKSSNLPVMCSTPVEASHIFPSTAEPEVEAVLVLEKMLHPPHIPSYIVLGSAHLHQYFFIARSLKKHVLCGFKESLSSRAELGEAAPVLACTACCEHAIIPSVHHQSEPALRCAVADGCMLRKMPDSEPPTSPILWSRKRGERQRLAGLARSAVLYIHVKYSAPPVYGPSEHPLQ